MGSSSRQTFEANREDIERLMELHALVGGSGPGRRVGLEVLNKSGIVLTCATWEAYVEDIATEVVAHYVSHGKAAGLPKSLKQTVAKELTNQAGAADIWKLAGSGWKKHLKARLKGLAEQRNTALNTPKAEVVDRFFDAALGISDVSDCWSWKGMNPTRARKKLDKYVTLRGDIAHRGRAAEAVKKGAVEDFSEHVQRLVDATDAHINSNVDASIGTPLFKS